MKKTWTRVRIIYADVFIFRWCVYKYGLAQMNSAIQFYILLSPPEITQDGCECRKRFGDPRAIRLQQL